MCFSPAISGSLAVIGLIGTIVCWTHPVLKKEHAYVLFAFYTLMEAFQTVQYSSVNKCGTWENKWLTEFAYLLVIVQPLMWNIVFYLRVSKQNKGVFMVAILMCILWIIVHALSRSPGLIKYYGLSTDVSSDSVVCTRRRNEKSHLYWQWPLADFNGLNANWLMYLALWLVPCLAIAETRTYGIIVTIGALLGAMITYKFGTGAEFASTWCYISIPMMCLALVDVFLIKNI